MSEKAERLRELGLVDPNETTPERVEAAKQLEDRIERESDELRRRIKATNERRPAEPAWRPAMPRGCDDAEEVVISYERAAFDVAMGRGGITRVDDYGALRRILIAALRAATPDDGAPR